MRPDRFPDIDGLFEEPFVMTQGGPLSSTLSVSVSPPRDWDRWGDLVRALTAHLVDRYGRAEVRDHWPFEVWNEANLSVFWSGTPEEYWRLYAETARAVKDVEPGVRVGGPATAAVGWIDDQLAAGAPVDFLSTHIYGSPPLDLRPLAGPRNLPLLWTEWGVTATHGSGINDTVFRGDVPAARHALGRGPGRGAGALGGVGPLRGTRPAAPAAARRLRPADGRQPGQAEVLGAAPGGAARGYRATGDAGRRRRA